MIKRFFCLLVILAVMLAWQPVALASIHEYPEGGDQVMYRSLQTLRDRSGQAWQVVLFKRLQAGQIQQLHLRLVGFPGLMEVVHPQDLQLTTGTAQVLIAPDFPMQTPLPNAGEYDLQQVMMRLNANPPLQLLIPLKQRQVELLVPPFVVQEWRTISTMQP